MSVGPTGLDDSALVAAWCAGDKQAGGVLVERHFAALYRFFRNKVSGDVDDLMQQTFMSCLEARPAFRGDCSFRTLLFQVARRRLYDHYRAKRRTREVDFTTTSARALGTSPSAALHRKNAAARLREALQELPVDAQVLLELRYSEGLSIEAVAQVFGVPAGTIKSRQFEARAQLKKALAARGYDGDYGAYMRTHLAGSAMACARNHGTELSGGEEPSRSSASR